MGGVVGCCCGGDFFEVDYIYIYMTGGTIGDFDVGWGILTSGDFVWSGDSPRDVAKDVFIFVHGTRSYNGPVYSYFR